jgi:hypothetical protein
MQNEYVTLFRSFSQAQPLPGSILMSNASSAFSVCVLLFLAAILPANAAYAAVSMEVGNQGMRLDDRGLSSSETGERNSGQNGVVMQTPPRPAANSTQVQELPYGIVPEVRIPWHPPGFQPPASGIRPPIGVVPPHRGGQTPSERPPAGNP